MHIPGIGNISFFKSLKEDATQGNKKAEGSQKAGSFAGALKGGGDIEQVRQRVIQDTVDLSPAAKAALEHLNLNDEISEGDAKAIAADTSAVLKVHQAIYLSSEDN